MKTLVFLLAWVLAVIVPRGAQSQRYFNQRHSFQPIGYSAGLLLSPRDSGYVVVGRAGLSAAQPQGRLLVAFFDSLGQVQRSRLFQHHSGPDLYTSIGGPMMALPDDGFAMAGTAVLPTGRDLGVLWRFDAQGDTLWTQTYTAPFDLPLYSAGGRPTMRSGLRLALRSYREMDGWRRKVAAGVDLRHGNVPPAAVSPAPGA